MTGEHRSTRRQTCSSAIMSTTNPTWIDLELNLALCSNTSETIYCITVILRRNFRMIKYAQFAFSRLREIYRNS